MEEVIQYLTVNWQNVLILFFVAEKLVKISPTKADDIIVDVIFNGIKQLVNKGKEEESE
tara:strand:- start:228 stop:404 length:177 start_codon:yes stop_codon:yes gene_type:complete